MHDGGVTYLLRQSVALVAAAVLVVAADMAWAALNLPMGFGV